MSGIPPATAASKSRSTPCSSASANSSVPTLASSSLLPVTTGLPASQRGCDQLAGRFDATDHLDDEIDVGVDDHLVGVAGEHTVGQRHAPVLRHVADGDAGDLEPEAGPVRRSSSACCSTSGTSAPPTLPQPSRPIRMVRGLGEDVTSLGSLATPGRLVVGVPDRSGEVSPGAGQ